MSDRPATVVRAALLGGPIRLPIDQSESPYGSTALQALLYRRQPLDNFCRHYEQNFRPAGITGRKQRSDGVSAEVAKNYPASRLEIGQKCNLCGIFLWTGVVAQLSFVPHCRSLEGEDCMPSSDGRQKLDMLDKKILGVLYREGRITKLKMSEEVGLSATRCWERMQLLEKAGIIRGYHADIDLRRLAKLSTFQVQVKLSDTSPAKARQFEQLIREVDQITTCQAVLGDVDYLMTVVAPDVESFQAIMDSISEVHGVRFQFVTYPISKVIKLPHSVSFLDMITQSDEG
ncbi:Lrp/AsnC family transcriptional regulator (plasmid) [Sphingobium sp. SJ10-10]|uniref:Lrp/AsnC family transcriptional regulator n=1 Tax=Sphingobium sp. SJ10-10 TaxID=3114999 RepID=UPI002E16DF1A|nr:Lrp/AsnC family transcriptional regulator [Sphingobium sp. SJ10-10]